ncbi:MAG TPA: 16S rRNA (uracil(1498)-N(3))-methyltransferase [Rhodocyclaceae bacterium]|nr:16S rRNA (uracil(1498)-N(3))-methyltransferase [Rhodocyclaceae bacterium]
MNPRFFCAEPMRVGSALQLPPEIAHHAVRVLRLRAGAPIVLFDGSGGEYRARLRTEGRVATALVEAYDPVERESPLGLVLVQALPAGDKLDWIVEKAVELGVSAIVPVVAERSVVRLSGERAEKRLAHLRGVARAACEQCGRNRVPVVEPIEALGTCLSRSRDWPGLRVVLSPEGAASVAGPPSAPRKVALLVGPEGGWSDAELKAIRVAGWEALALGTRILRTETAGLAALAVMQARWGDFRPSAGEA